MIEVIKFAAQDVITASGDKEFPVKVDKHTVWNFGAGKWDECWIYDGKHRNPNCPQYW